ncbi:MAG: threonine synthase [Cytophagia bacterium]|nr:threonine synthase [Cytophagia bacterium]
MKFYSTANKNHLVDFQEAVVSGLAPDNGLYMPSSISRFPITYFETLHQKSFSAMAYDIALALIGDALPQDKLKQFVDHAVSFDAPLVALTEDVYALELFHGPTLAFKDFGARFMSQVLAYYAKQLNKEVVILAATSGDTGSAVANGFYQVSGTRVVVLYPAGKVSNVQEKQFTTLGHNITAIAIEGTFDDCQRLVKLAFQDKELKQNHFLSSANSINMARLIPQVFYYFFAWSRLQKTKPIVFSVPSGNFGNLTAGLIAKNMGLPIDHFIAATNANDVVPEYFKNGEFKPRASQLTISNAMDVGNPSNFIRILDLHEHDLVQLRKDISAFAFNDEETAAAMKEVYEKHHYILDPHGAVAYLGLKKFQQKHPDYTGVFLETAHPAKFIEVVEDTLQQKINMPDTLRAFMNKEKKSISCSSDFNAVKTLLLNLLS